MSASYGTPTVRRPVIVPSVLGAIVCVAGVALIDTEGFTVILYVVAILALIVIVMAAQVKRWWPIVPLGAIAVLWNPVLPIDLPQMPWFVAHLIAAVIFVVVGALVRVPVDARATR